MPLVNEILMPMDLAELPVFQRLMGAVKRDPAVALAVWYALWAQLGYEMQEGNAPGLLLATSVPVFVRRISKNVPRGTIGEPGWEDEPEAWGVIINELVEPVRLLRKDADNYFCERFAQMHGGLQTDTKEAKGGQTRWRRERQKKIGGVEDQGELLMVMRQDKFVDGEGQPLAEADRKGVLWLVRQMDNALYQKEREKHNFTEGLIQSALVLWKAHKPEQLLSGLELIGKNKGHPHLAGMTTELLLPKFRDVLPRLT